MYLKLNLQIKNVTYTKCVKCTKLKKSYVLNITLVPSHFCAKCDNINDWIFKKNLFTNWRFLVWLIIKMSKINYLWCKKCAEHKKNCFSHN